MRGLVLIIYLIMIGSLVSAIYYVYTFTEGLASGNLTFTGNQNMTINLSIPRYSNVTNVTISLTGYNNSLNNTYLEIATPDLNYEWNYTGTFNISQNVTLNATLINVSLPACYCTGCFINGFNCTIPFIFHSDTAGILEYSNFNVTYDTDTTAPVTTITINGSDWTNQDILVNLSCSDSWSGCDYISFNTTETNGTFTNKVVYQENANQSNGSASDSIVFVNYSKSNYKSALWLIKTGNDLLNLTIPQDCFDADSEKLILRMQSYCNYVLGSICRK